MLPPCNNVCVGKILKLEQDYSWNISNVIFNITHIKFLFGFGFCCYLEFNIVFCILARMVGWSRTKNAAQSINS